MGSHHYHFQTHWRLEATAEEAFRLIDAVPDYVRWWPAVWLRVEVLQPGGADGIGGRARLTTKGYLPYILTWEGTTLEKTFPQRKVFRASGDFEGHGIWTFRPDGSFVDVEYNWEIVADKPLLKYLSFLSARSSRSTTIGRWRGEKKACGWNWLGAEPEARRNWHGLPRHPPQPEAAPAARLGGWRVDGQRRASRCSSRRSRRSRRARLSLTRPTFFWQSAWRSCSIAPCSFAIWGLKNCHGQREAGPQ